MIGALWTGISGLAGQQTALDNESNNIANVNTVGYKSSRISFADQMYQNKIGKGTTILDAEKLYTQGNLKVTGVSFDMALSGDGFFAVSDTRGAGMAETYYTRAGNFRMGDNGTLQDSAGNSVQGWAMTKLTDDDIVSSDQNINRFTDDFVKMGGSQIIRNTNTIETITAKMTDYTETATADSIDVFSGAGYKSKASKVSDVEGLISSYNEALINYKNEPDGTSVTPGVYQNTLDYSGAISNLDGDGDTISVYIDGNKYTQTWDTDLSTTMKNFSDQLSSKIKGVNAYITDAPGSTERDPTNTGGYLHIESLIPGETLTISQLEVTKSTGASTPGVLTDLSVKVEKGSGYAAVEAARDALEKAVTGKQQDVYTPTDLGTPGGSKDYTYQLTIYDPQGNQNISVPSSPLEITDPTDIDAIVDDINAIGGEVATPGELAYYVKAYNINGNLVIETLDNNYELEFSSDMKELQYGTTKTTTAADGVSEVHTYDLQNKPTPNGTSDYKLDIVTANGDSFTSTATDAADMDDLITQLINNSGGDYVAEGDTTAGTIQVYKNANGDLVLKNNDENEAFDPVLQVDENNDGDYDILDVPRNAVYSGRQGANAEFLEITTTIEQTSSRGELQLKLDSLGISNSPFGDFSVDSTGLITMQQDGASFAVGQVAVALFNDNRGLEPIGDNLLKATDRSGTAIYNLNNNKTAAVKSNTLELSTADLSEALVNLMVFQRAFEANAKSITTADSVLNTLINLKR